MDEFTEDKVADPSAWLTRKKSKSTTTRDHRQRREFRHMVRVELHLKDGKRMARTVEAARGSEQKFASEVRSLREIRAAAAAPCLPRRVRAAGHDALLEKLGDAAQIAQLLARK